MKIKKKLAKTFHDVALGLFVNGIYGLWSATGNLANITLVIISLIAMYITNKGDE